MQKIISATAKTGLIIQTASGQVHNNIIILYVNVTVIVMTSKGVSVQKYNILTNYSCIINKHLLKNDTFASGN